jgi:hypothetical protein
MSDNTQPFNPSHPDWVTTHLLETYLEFIKGSIGTKAYQHWYGHRQADPSKTLDLTAGGTLQLSCSYFVSAVLTTFGLIEKIHATTAGTIRDMQSSGWHELTNPQVGAVLIWEKYVLPDGAAFPHCGFYVAEGKAISHVGGDIKMPYEHDWKHVPPDPAERKVASIWWHDKLV